MIRNIFKVLRGDVSSYFFWV